MANAPVRPTRLELAALPRQSAGSAQAFARGLVSAFNLARTYPNRLAALIELLEAVVDKGKAYEKAQKAYEAQMAKVSLDAKAKANGIELDARKSLKAMQADYDTALKERAEQAAIKEEEAIKADALAKLKEAAEAAKAVGAISDKSE